MEINEHPCPVSWYIGQIFARKRAKCEKTLKDVAEELQISKEYLNHFENGNLRLDATFLLKLEKYYGLSYRDYKPPIDYAGFLGMYADDYKILQLMKRYVQQHRPIFKTDNHLLETKLLKVRFSPLRGAVRN